MIEPDTIDWQERYDITCPDCGYSMLAAPSISHQMGMYDLGGATCPACRTAMSIIFQPETNTMTTKIYIPPMVSEVKQ